MSDVSSSLVETKSHKRRRRWNDGGGCRDSILGESTPGALQTLFGEASATRRPFRLEHRLGGEAARYINEERILVFVTGRAGAVGKVIFSQDSAADSLSSEEASRARQITHDARIHALYVHPDYRGCGLGALLFTLATASMHRPSLCRLEAEEDSRRHGRLVDFYERLGCVVRLDAKVAYLYGSNNDMYRKVPMKIALPVVDVPRGEEAFSSLLERSFAPIQLFCGGENASIKKYENEKQASVCVRATNDSTTACDWLLVENAEDGSLELCTTRLDLLVVKDDDDLDLLSLGDHEREVHVDVAKFLAREASDDLYLLQLVTSKLFLTVNMKDHLLNLSVTPSFWNVDRSAASLTWTTDTPRLRQHYRSMYSLQTVDYVTKMREHYTSFNLRESTIWNALELVKGHAASPLSQALGTEPAPLSSLRSKCFRIAELLRHCGHPDWIQLVGLVYHLGSAVKSVEETRMEDDSDQEAFDWTIACETRVVGSLVPVDSSFIRYQGDDTAMSKAASLDMYAPQCGLDQVLLCWTGPEYMYHLLRHNHVMIPEEGLQVLRLAALQDWHTGGHYGWLANDQDESVKSLAYEFYAVLQAVDDECRQNALKIDDAACNRLWKECYACIAQKYRAGGVLTW